MLNFRLALLGLLLAWHGVLLAHPYHQSLLEIEWNNEQAYWELALRFLPEDLEDALQLYAGKRVDLERTEGVDALLLQYVQMHLQLNAADADDAMPQAEIDWQWVGKQVEYKSVWLYVQVKAPPPPLRLRNTLMFERNGQQINRVFLLHAGQRVPFDFTPHMTPQFHILPVLP